MREPTGVEREAVMLRWRHLNPDAPPDARPSLVEAEELLREVRARAAAVEAEAVRMLMRRLRNPATRSGHYSKHAQAFFFFILVPALLLAGLLAILNVLMASP